MYYKLDEKDLKYIKIASNYTNTDYELEGDFIPVDSMMSCIEDLICHIDYLEENIEDLKKDLQDNYKPLSNEVE